MLWRAKDEADPKAPERRATARLDKAFPVWLEGDRGVAHGIARNISPGGLFVETSVTQPIGSQVRVTFTSSDGDMTAVGEVRYVCALVGRPATASYGPVALRGMGVRFLYFEAAGSEPGGGEHPAIH
jgi:hypothetical protein